MFACSTNLIRELYFTETSNIFNHFLWFLTAFDKYIKISVLDLEKLEDLSIVILHKTESCNSFIIVSFCTVSMALEIIEAMKHSNGLFVNITTEIFRSYSSTIKDM